MTQAYLVAAAKETDGNGSLAPVERHLERLKQRNIEVPELSIEPLSADWHTPEAADRFRSGCGPIEALAEACKLLADGASAVVIRGKDMIKTGYPRDERLQKMAIYGDDYPLTQGYDEVAQQFIQYQQSDAEQFKSVASALFENYQRTYSAENPEATPPGERWFEPLTSLFRGVDCANPIIDFHGALLICDAATADQLEIPSQQRLKIRGIGLGRLPDDGKEQIPDIARYDHLQEAYQAGCNQAGINFTDSFKRGDALLDTYTCYPVVPMAFLLNSGMVSSLEEIPGFLAQYPITVTGGMNLARAPWNNPALNGLISMYTKLCEGDITLGAVHGNGGLGYRQGIAILERSDG